MTEKTTDTTKDWQKIAETAVDEGKAETETAAYAAETEESADESVKTLENPTIKALEEKLTAAEQLAHENRDKLLRALSELDNVKRRAQQDIERANKYSLKNFAEELLPVGDSLVQALHSCDNDKSENVKILRDGVELTLKMFYSVLKKFHIEVINPVGELFDPNLHEAMLTQPNNTVAPNTILTVVQNGYRLHDRVLRPARVIVAKG